MGAGGFRRGPHPSGEWGWWNEAALLCTYRALGWNSLTPRHAVGGISSEPGLLLASDLTRLRFLLLGRSEPRRLLPCSEALLLTDVFSGPALSSHCLELSLPVLSIFKDPSWKLSMASVQSN